MASKRYTARRPPKGYDADWMRQEFRSVEDVLAQTITASVVYDPGNLVDGAGVTTTLAVPRARLGDFVQAAFSLDTQDVLVQGRVSAADVVSVRFQNETGGAVDLASGTLHVRVITG